MAIAALAQALGEPWVIWTGLALFVLGLSHGAGDEQEGELSSFTLVHAGAYLLIGAAIAGVFLAAPLLGLALFFALSAWHFSRSDCHLHKLTRNAIAGLAVGGSALFRPEETAQVLSFVIGDDVPRNFLRFLALCGVVGTGFAVYAAVKGRRGFGHAVVAGLAVALLHPVLAVGLIFLTAHAIPVQERQIAAYGTPRVLRAIALPTLIASVGAIALAWGTVSGLVPMSLAIAMSFGLATPHMLTERLER